MFYSFIFVRFGYNKSKHESDAKEGWRKWKGTNSRRRHNLLYTLLRLFLFIFVDLWFLVELLTTATGLIEFPIMMPTGKHSNAVRASGKEGGTSHLNDGDQGQRPSFYLFFPTVHLIMKMLK